jgi:hypothetical protein
MSSTCFFKYFPGYLGLLLEMLLLLLNVNSFILSSVLLPATTKSMDLLHMFLFHNYNADFDI